MVLNVVHNNTITPQLNGLIVPKISRVYLIANSVITSTIAEKVKLWLGIFDSGFDPKMPTVLPIFLFFFFLFNVLRY